MRQKRELFQKQIRREAIEKIFKNNRLKYFNYSYKPNFTLQYINQIKDECISEFTQSRENITEALQIQNQEDICLSVKESYEFLKKILSKGKHNPECLIFIIRNWLDFGFDQRLIDCANLFQITTKLMYNSLRKQTYRYAVSQFYLIFNYESAIQKQKLHIQKIFNFLFLALAQLQSEPQSIEQILVLLNSIMYFEPDVRHKFFFQNEHAYRNESENKSYNRLISFENICTVMFLNLNRLKQYGNQQQRARFHQVEMNFIHLFKLYSYQLQYMEKYIDKCQKKSLHNKISWQEKQQFSVYDTTLRMFNVKQQIKLKNFLDKTNITIILQIILDKIAFYHHHWPQEPTYEENLADSLEALRLLLEFYPKAKIVQQFSGELQQLMNLLISRQLSVIVKNQIISLIDTIIFIDQADMFTQHLIKNDNLFEKIWCYQEPSILKVKLNIVNNLLLSRSGFQAVMKYLSHVYIELFETKFVGLALTFCLNYFLRTQYSLGPSSRFGLVQQILYSLPTEQFHIQDIEIDVYILTHLYDNGFAYHLPQRYAKWINQYNSSKYTSFNDSLGEQEYCPEYQARMKLVDNMEKHFNWIICENEARQMVSIFNDTQS